MDTFNEVLVQESKSLYRELSSENKLSKEDIDFLLTLRLESKFSNLNAEQYRELNLKSEEIFEKLLKLISDKANFEIGQRVKWTYGSGSILSRGIYRESLEGEYSIVRMVESGGLKANSEQKVLTSLLEIDED